MSKKRPVVFRIVFSIFQAIFGMIDVIMSTIFNIISFILRFVYKQIKRERQQTVIRSTKYYNVKASLKKLLLVKLVSGNYDWFTKNLNKKSLIILIFGKRGSGKSALGFRILENIYASTKRKCYVLGVEQNLLPSWISSVNEIDNVQSGSAILVDEGAISFGSRNSMSKSNKNLSELMATARHKDLTLIFITQNTGMVDKNVLKLADTLLVKEGSLLQLEMERAEIKKFYAKAKPFFDSVSDKVSHVYSVDSELEGFLKYSLPGFWSESVSKNQSKKTNI